MNRLAVPVCGIALGMLVLAVLNAGYPQDQFGGLGESDPARVECRRRSGVSTRVPEATLFTRPAPRFCLVKNGELVSVTYNELVREFHSTGADSDLVSKKEIYRIVRENAGSSSVSVESALFTKVKNPNVAVTLLGFVSEPDYGHILLGIALLVAVIAGVAWAGRRTAAAPAPKEAEAIEESWVNDLGSSDSDMRLAAMSRVADLRRPVSGSIRRATLEALNAVSTDSRFKQAIQVFCKVAAANPGWEKDMIRVLQGAKDWNAVSPVAMGLGALRCREAVPMLIELERLRRPADELPADDPYYSGTEFLGYRGDIRFLLVKALGMIRDERAVPFLTVALRGELPKSGSWLRGKAAKALGEIRTAEARAALKLRASFDPSDDVRAIAEGRLERWDRGEQPGESPWLL